LFTLGALWARWPLLTLGAYWPLRTWRALFALGTRWPLRTWRALLALWACWTWGTWRAFWTGNVAWDRQLILYLLYGLARSPNFLGGALPGVQFIQAFEHPNQVGSPLSIDHHTSTGFLIPGRSRGHERVGAWLHIGPAIQRGELVTVINQRRWGVKLKQHRDIQEIIKGSLWEAKHSY